MMAVCDFLSVLIVLRARSSTSSAENLQQLTVNLCYSDRDMMSETTELTMNLDGISGTGFLVAAACAC